jgi:uncharacterized membrane protein
VSPEEKNEQEARLVRVAAQISRTFSGPLPPPEILQKYNEIVPGAADRIIKMAESQHHHRQALEKNVVSSNVFSQKLGLGLGFVIAMTAIGGGIWLSAIGRSGSGLIAIIGALAALVSVFVYGKVQQSKELADKASAISSSAEEPHEQT